MKDLNLKKKMSGSILIAEDEPAILEVYSRTLAKHDITIHKAEDGQEAWDIFQEEDDVSILITDVDMPRMNGIELILNVLKAKPLTQIIVITGKLDDALALYGIKKNVVCLPKPVEPNFVVIAAAASAVRYRDQCWEEELRTVTASEDWDQEAVNAVLKRAPWRNK